MPEAFEAYAAALHEMSSSCDFEATDKAVRDQLLERASSQYIRECLLLEGTSLTLNRAVDIGRHIEQTQRKLRSFLETLSSSECLRSLQAGVTARHQIDCATVVVQVCTMRRRRNALLGTKSSETATSWDI